MAGSAGLKGAHVDSTLIEDLMFVQNDNED